MNVESVETVRLVDLTAADFLVTADEFVRRCAKAVGLNGLSPVEVHALSEAIRKGKHRLDIVDILISKVDPEDPRLTRPNPKFVMREVDSFSTQQYSYIVGAFQIGYTIMQPVCGLIVDLIGLRLGFALFAALWSLAGCLQGGVTGWLSLAGARGLMGLTEAAAIPAGMKAVAEWFPDKEKSIAVGFFNVGTSFGALIAPPLVGAITLTLGWRTAFVVTGAIGFFWAALWYAFYRSPSEHALLSPDEREQILSGQSHPDGSAPKPSTPELLATRRFWAIAIPRFFAEPAWQTFSFWIPLYLASERHMDLKQIALFAWLPFLAADFGGVFGGFVAPFLMKTFGVTLVWSRIWGVVLGALMMIGPASIGLVSSPYMAIALFSLGGFAHQTISVLVNTLSADLFDSREVGTVSGFAGMAAWTGGLGFSLLVGALADTVGYGPLFGLLGVFDLVGTAALIVLIGDERHVERFAAA